MKTITFFILLVGIWGCESKSQISKQLSRAETEQTPKSSNRTHKNSSTPNIPISINDFESNTDLKIVKEDSFTFKLITLAIIALLFGFLYFYFSKSKDLLSENEGLKQRLAYQLDELNSLKHEVERKYEEVASMNELPILYENKSEIINYPNITVDKEINGFRYGGRPNEDGSFTELEYSFVEGKSFYCFDIYRKQATFWIENKPNAMAYLLKHPDILLNPVCEAVNAFLSTTKAIMTEKDGEGHAKWDDDKQVWKVTQKAKIRYLSEDELEANGFKKQEGESEEMRLLKVENQQLKERISKQESEIPVLKVEEINAIVNGVKKNKNEDEGNIKYAGKPNKNGNFDKLEDKFISGKHLYCLAIKDGKAEFWINDDSITFDSLTRYPDVLLRPVCEELNTQTAKHKNIITELDNFPK